MRLIVALIHISGVSGVAVSSLHASLVGPRLAIASPRACRSAGAPSMMGKKKTKRKDGTVARPQNFGGMGDDSDDEDSTFYAASTTAPPTLGGVDAEAAPSAPRGMGQASQRERVDQVLRERGIMPANSGAPQASPDASLNPLSRIPKKGQELLERFFGAGAVATGVVFLLSGISVSGEALCKVLDYPLPQAVDDALVNVVEPILTPSLFTLFGFSISLGLLKQLQFNDEASGVLYREDDDD